MLPALVRSRRALAAAALVTATLGLSSCRLTSETSLPPFTKPADVTYDNSLGVNITAMQALSENLYVQDVVVGTGRTVAVGDSIEVYYTGKLNTGFQFDARQSPATPFGTILDTNRLIRGWVGGLPGAKVGGTRRMVIGPALAYQYATVRDPQSNAVVIPSNSVLIFDVQIVAANAR